MSIDIDKNKTHILQVYNDVLDDRSATDWALFGYEGQTNALKVFGSGDDGIEELAEELNASKIMYGVIRIQDPKTSRTKIILLNWQGESAPNLRKGICARHLPDVKRMLKGVHITLTARTEEDVDTDAILDAVSKATSTEYNFKDRSELPDKNVPVGTNYKRTNPQAEIDANRRNKFWEEQEAEEKVRKEEEIKKREEEIKKLERERVDREIRDSKHREEINRERNARIFADKKAEMSATENTKRLAGSPVWKKEEESNRREEEEVERSRRADMMRMERKKEAESLIGHKTHQARSIFESQSHTLSHPITKNEPKHVDSSRPIPRKLKEFNPNMDTSMSYQKEKENSAPKKSVGSRWPPPSEESVPEQRKTVPGKITEWKPKESVKLSQNENHQINSFQVVEQQQQQQHHQTPSSATDLSSRGRNTFQNNTSQHHQSTVEPIADFTQPYSSPYSSSAHSQSHTSVTSTPVSSYSLAASSASPIDTSPSSPLSKSTPSPQSAGIVSGNDGERSNGGDRFPLGDSHSKIKDHSSSSSYRTNGNTSQYEEKEENDPYREEEEDEFGPVSMTYEVDGVEYQILTEHGICARALYDYQAADETEITFDPGDIITNIDQIDVGWWQGVSPMGVFGLFPANYVELINGTKIH